MAQSFRIAFLSLVFCVGPSSGDAADGLLAYTGPHIGDELERFIAEKAKPTIVKAKDGETAKSIIRSHCGHITDVLLTEMQRINADAPALFASDAPPMRDGRELLVPACPYWEEGPIPYLAKTNDTLETIAANMIGHRGNHTTTAIKKVTKRNSPTLVGTNLDRNLKEGDKLFLPYISKPVRLEPKDGMSIDEFMANLRAKSNAARTNGKPYSVEDRFQFLAEANPSISHSNCADTSTGYPLSELELSRVIKLNEWFSAKFERNPYGHEPVVILVVDDGVQGSEAVELGDANTYPKSLPMAFAHSYAPDEVSNIDNTFGQRYDQFSSGRIAPTISYLPVPHNENMLHGTHVTDILLGGGFAPAFPDLFKGYFKIAHRNIVSRVEGADIWLFNPSYAFRAIREMDNIERTSRERVIINLSSGGMDAIRNIDHKLNGDNALLVTSAGNESSDLDQSRLPNIYPANYGGEHSTNVISVAASDATLDLIAESNYGKTSVDVAAPGCGVVSNVGGQSEQLQAMSGTSMAAPFVSLAAALLAKYGMPLDDIKSRIWKTVDIGDNSFAAKIGSGGVLNIQRALALGFDTITTKDGSLLIGALRQQVFNLCSETEQNAQTASQLDDFAPENFERLDITTGADCPTASAALCVKMVLTKRGSHYVNLLRSNSLRCTIPPDAILAQTVKFVALDWDASTGSITSVAKDVPLAEVQTIVPSEFSGSPQHPYRSSIIKLHERRPDGD